MSEAQADKEWWGQTDFQPREYLVATPFYARSLVRIINALPVESIFEFGCNSGRNLELLRTEGVRKFELSGVDVNDDSIRFGRKKWSLDIHTADESFLEKRPESYDIIFRGCHISCVNGGSTFFRSSLSKHRKRSYRRRSERVD